MRALLLSFLFLTLVYSKTPKEILLDSPKYVGGGGFFHNFNIVLGCLDLCDKNSTLSLRVDFKQEGLYFEQNKGSNWWSYYFENSYFPAQDQSKKRALIKTLKDFEKGALGNGAHFFFSRKRGFDLINRYIRVKKDILDQVELFRKERMGQGYLIGVHYRGSDKWLEANFISYLQVIEEVKKVVLKHEKSQIFVATDEKGFLDAMIEAFGNKVIFYDSFRSENQEPIHYQNRAPYLRGKEALIDALLLSKSHILLRTNSNLSAVSAFFNPNMDVVNLNQVRQEWFLELIKEGSPNELNQ